MVEIRVMVMEDYEGVFDLWQNTPEMGINTTDDGKEGIAKYLHRNPTTSFVAVWEGKIVGAILAGHDGRRGFIQHMTVAAECRKKGIATKLLNAAMAALENEGIHKVALLNFKENEPANAFWEINGFLVREDVFYRNKNIHELEYRTNPFRHEQ